jgi:hypothetical protein
MPFSIIAHDHTLTIHRGGKSGPVLAICSPVKDYYEMGIELVGSNLTIHRIRHTMRFACECLHG